MNMRFHYITHSERFAVIQGAMNAGERIRALGELLNEAYSGTGAGPEDDVLVWDELENVVATGFGVKA